MKISMWIRDISVWAGFNFRKLSLNLLVTFYWKFSTWNFHGWDLSKILSTTWKNWLNFSKWLSALTNLGLEKISIAWRNYHRIALDGIFFVLYTLCVICSLFVGFNNSASLSMFNLCSFYSRSSFRILLFSSFKISRLVILGFLVNILTLFEYKKDAWKLSSFNTNYDTKSSTENGH